MVSIWFKLLIYDHQMIHTGIHGLLNGINSWVFIFDMEDNPVWIVYWKKKSNCDLYPTTETFPHNSALTYHNCVIFYHNSENFFLRIEILFCSKKKNRIAKYKVKICYKFCIDQCKQKKREKREFCETQIYEKKSQIWELIILKKTELWDLNSDF